jgi:hypothetical protein
MMYGTGRTMSKGDTNMTMNSEEMNHETLEYREEVTQTLQEAISDFLEFSTARELIRVIDLTINR